MIRSMTGFGKAECELAGKRVTVEIRSLNSRQLDINLKLPAIYREKEALLRNQIASRLSRGKIDVIIFIDQVATDQVATDQVSFINKAVVKHYFDELEKTAKELNINENDPLEMMKMALRMPDTLINYRTRPDEKEWDTVHNSFLYAVDRADKYRAGEGEAMKSDLQNRISAIETSLSAIDRFEGTRIDNIRTRLQQNLNEFLSNNNIDRNRFEQEIIFYLEKLDITEEKVRLKNHIDYLKDTLNGEEASGKKLGFISQEIGREINTIGSKANDFNIQKLVVQMKDDLEKIKEQSLNIL
jgi:uncharacterized protein (TIGR00255 family)